MCRAFTEPDVGAALAALLAEIRARLAEEAGVPPECVAIGPIDFGPDSYSPVKPRAMHSLTGLYGRPLPRRLAHVADEGHAAR